MKKIFVVLSLLVGLNIYTPLTAKASNTIQQTNTALKDAYKAMLNVITYDEEGNLLQSGYGFFINNEGTGLAAYSIFKDAHKAIAVDYKGNKLPINRILGANSTYDLVKFSTLNANKIESFDIAEQADNGIGTQLQMVHYSGKKKSTPLSVNIEAADAFQNFKYFVVSAENNAKNFGCPLTNTAGEVVAIVQKNVDEKAKSACAIDARFANKLQISSTSVLNADLNAIYITKGIPANEKEALTYIYMLGTKDSTAAINAMNDFIEAYPENAEGYVNRASFYAQYHLYEASEADFNEALELSDKKNNTIGEDAIHNSFSKVIYNDILNSHKDSLTYWSMDKAIGEAQKAFELNPSPYYLLQQAHCLFAKNEYYKAYETYVKVNTTRAEKDVWSTNAQAETWLFAARAFEMNMRQKESGATMTDSLHLITLLDSAIAVLPKPYTPVDAKYVLERAQRYEMVKQYRKAVLDYNEYEKAIGPNNLNDKFYYLREQAEMKCHMYQQALDDIRTAQAFNPKDPFYPVEEAIILLQAGMFKEAIDVCQKSLKSLPENPDCYKIMGIAYGELKNKKMALQHLNKARELGDPTVDAFIEKYR